MMTKLPVFLINKTSKTNTFFGIKEEKSYNDFRYFEIERFSANLEKDLKLLEDTVFEIITNFEQKNEDLRVSLAIYDLFKKYFLVEHYRSLYHKTFFMQKPIVKIKNTQFDYIKKETIENDLQIIVKADTIADIETSNSSDLLKFLVKQVSYGYITFWTAPRNHEFLLTDNGMNYSKDCFAGGKLTHVQELLKTPKNKEKEIREIEESLDYFPSNFLITPITPRTAMVLCSPFMSLYTEEFKLFQPPFSIFNLTFSGLRNENFELPADSILGHLELKIIKKHELTEMEMFYNNELLLNNTQNFLSWENFNKIKSSVLFYQAKPNRVHDVDRLPLSVKENFKIQFKEAELKTRGKFLNYYNLKYRNKNNQEKCYEMVSHDDNIQTVEDLHNKSSQAVVLVIFDENHEKILLNKEFRMAIGTYTYGSVAGLIEDGETFEEAAKRELKEETGLDLVKIIDVLPPSYTATGISNEKTICIFCEAKGTIDISKEEINEDIEPMWFTKEQIKELFNGTDEIPIAARTQMFCYMWAIGKIY